MIDLNEFKNSYKNIYASAKYNSQSKILKSRNESYDSSVAVEDHQDVLLINQEEYSIQRIVREWFNKGPINFEAKIGTHPDFKEIEGTEAYVNQHITTIFVDIKNSTRLSLIYPLEDVFQIKNSILRAASELVRAMDGHVHRFMGDALMAYFGSKHKSKESSIMEAISCASMLRIFMSESVLPFLSERFNDDFDIGFRVGLDFGKDEEILWSSYGYGNVAEVTATSFFVDVASKLQSLASKDQIMIGDNLLKFIDFPDIFQKIKTKVIDDKEIEMPLLKPNYSLKDGSKLNYNIRQLSQEKFIEVLPIPTSIKSKYSKKITNNNGVSFNAVITDKSDNKENYHSISRCLEKNTDIDFVLKINRSGFNQDRFPLKYRFSKKNHGNEANNEKSLEPEIKDGVIYFPKNNLTHQYSPATAVFSRSTAYRGLHTVNAQIIDNQGTVLYSEVIGIHVQ